VLSDEHSPDVPEEISDDPLEDEDASVTDDHAMEGVPKNSTTTESAKSTKTRNESQGATENVSRPMTRTRTRKVRPPDRLMLVTLGTSLSETPGYVAGQK
jgi:hypothetical protein